ncbi:MAG: response regulator transcription factor [Terriglobales bacterium]
MRYPRGYKVQIVDDERALTDSLVLILRQRGILAMGSYSGQTGLEDALRWHPDAVLIDVLLPDASGIEIAVALRRQLPACRVLLMSGQATTADLLDNSQAQGDHFEVLPKPLSPEHLLERIEALRAAA